MSRSTAADPAAWSGLRPIPLPPLAPNPFVSVLVANYNYARYLPDCLNSVLQQSYTNFEVIVCDDGSTDESLQVLDGLARLDNRIRIVRQPNGGQASALNRAYVECSGQVISILDADDVLEPDKIAATIQAFHREPTAGLATHFVAIIDSEGELKRRPALPACLDDGWKGSQMLQQGMDCSLPPATGLSLRREIAGRVFPIPNCFRQIADGFVARAAALLSAIVPTNLVLARYRIHSNNLTGIHVCSVEGLRKQVSLSRLLVTETCLWAESNLGAHFDPEPILETNSSYLESALALHILTTPKAHRNVTLRRAVELGPSSPSRKLAWRVLYRLESGIAGRVLAQWWGPSSLKAAFHRILMSVDSKSQLTPYAK